MPDQQSSDFQSIVILTGAGMSAESGVQTFRDPDGIWAKYSIEDVATPEAFARNPHKVHGFYNSRRALLATVQPNAAHIALARLEREFPGSVLTVTQNVDDLHERAGSANLIHMHGELAKAFCHHCQYRCACDFDLSIELVCAHCGKDGGMRPDVVWFGEMPYQMDEIYDRLSEADLFISVGTSGNVYPAAGFVALAHSAGAHTVELNLEPSEGASYFAEHHHGPATRVVPAFVDKLLKSA